jgi:hypothetical protein
VKNDLYAGNDRSNTKVIWNRKQVIFARLLYRQGEAVYNISVIPTWGFK